MGIWYDTVLDDMDEKDAVLKEKKVLEHTASKMECSRKEAMEKRVAFLEHRMYELANKLDIFTTLYESDKRAEMRSTKLDKQFSYMDDGSYK